MDALCLEQLTKTYSNDVHALKGIDLTVEPGAFFGLLGPNGAGKSTAIGIITSLVNKTSGNVRVFGHDLITEASAVKQAIGLVPQEFNFNQFEAAEQIIRQQAGYYGIPRHEAKQRAKHCLQQLDLWEKRQSSPRQLSGGMKRRLMIARAMVHSPRLLILDEPTAGVDIEIRRATWQLLEEINAQGTTVILTTHYLEEAESLCRRIAIIDHGQIVEHCDTKTLLSQLKTETFVLDLAQPITSCPSLSEFHAKLIDDHTLEIRTDGDHTLNELFAQLSTTHIQVRSMRNKANRLEELFINRLNTPSKDQDNTVQSPRQAS